MALQNPANPSLACLRLCNVNSRSPASNAACAIQNSLRLRRARNSGSVFLVVQNKSSHALCQSEAKRNAELPVTTWPNCGRAPLSAYSCLTNVGIDKKFAFQVLQRRG